MRCALSDLASAKLSFSISRHRSCSAIMFIIAAALISQWRTYPCHYHRELELPPAGVMTYHPTPRERHLKFLTPGLAKIVSSRWLCREVRLSALSHVLWRTSPPQRPGRCWICFALTRFNMFILSLLGKFRLAIETVPLCWHPGLRGFIPEDLLSGDRFIEDKNSRAIDR